MVSRLEINPDVIKWAINESDLYYEDIKNKFKYLDLWISRERKPTPNQLKDFGKFLRIPYGYLLLDEPPKTSLSTTEFRTLNNSFISKPSRNLIDIINDMSSKQLWMNEYRQRVGVTKSSLPGKYIDMADCEIINSLRSEFDIFRVIYDTGTTPRNPLKRLTDELENKGVLVMSASNIFNNTHRPFDLEEFRAFYLFDRFAPLIFLNGKDSETGKLFSLVHETIHCVTSEDPDLVSKVENEARMNRIVAELLMPEIHVISNFKTPSFEKAEALESRFKVSLLAIGVRLDSLNLADEDLIQKINDETERRIKEKNARKTTGGPGYIQLRKSNLSKSFIDAVNASERSGKILRRDAFALVNISNNTNYTKLMEASK